MNIANSITPHHSSLPFHRNVRNVVLAALGADFLLVGYASSSGRLAALGRYAPPAAAVTTLLLVLASYAASPRLRSWFSDLGVRRLTALQVLRVTATPLFLWYGFTGFIPHVFAVRAGWGDAIAAGVALLAVTLWRRPFGYVIAQLVGFVDFLAAFATAIPLAQRDPAAMLGVTALPLAWIPFFFVGLFASLHVIVLVLQWRQRSRSRREDGVTG